MSPAEITRETVPPSGRRRWRHAWDVVVVLTARDLKAQYKRSFLGFGWALAGPILQLIIFATIFRNVLGGKIPHYPAYIYIGVLVWSWFQGSATQGATLITGNASLARQPGFPLTLLPHVTVSVRFIHFAIALPLLFGLLWTQGLRPTAAWGALPLLIAIQYLLSVGIAYPLASLNVLHRDVQHMVTALLQLLMFASPIFYGIRLVPDFMQAWFAVHPVAILMTAWRNVLIDGSWPDFRALAILGAASIALVVVGRRLFIAQSHRFVEEM